VKANLPSPAHYTYRVSWSAEDEEFVATCAEFPFLSHLAESQSAALSGIERLVAKVIRDLAKSGEVVPEPYADRRYSGKFNLRVGESLHRQLVVEAAEENLSLNQYVIRRLISRA
jgi:predicted HicB family RNase H-like nuclease